MEKISKEFKIRLIALFLLSNLSSLMLGTYLIEPEIGDQIDLQQVERENYVSLKLKVLINTKLDANIPFVLTNKERSIYIPYVFYISDERDTNNQFSMLEESDSTREIILSVPNQFVSKLINAKGLLLVPQIERNLLVTLKEKKGEQYEISF